MRSLMTICLFLLISSAAAQSVPEWLNGEWEGLGIQTNTNTTWPTYMHMEPGAEFPLVTYASLECGGQWIFLGEQEDGRLKFRERITETIGRCSLNDYVYISQRNQDQLFVEYAHGYAPNRIIATLLLDRRLRP